MAESKRRPKKEGARGWRPACIRFSPEHYQQIQERARAKGQTLSTFVRTAAIEALRA